MENCQAEFEALRSVAPLDARAMAEAERRWNSVAKPLHSLGRFETMLVRIAGIQRTADIQLAPRGVLVFCGDHGVVAEGVSQSGSDVTRLVARSIAEGTANVNHMAAVAGAAVWPVDVGMLGDVAHPAMRVRKVARGTSDIARGPAMTRAQACQAVRVGMELVAEMADAGMRLAAAGEMGIGNTTAASALACALLKLPPKALTGRGAGLSDAELAHKIGVIERALAVNHAGEREDPLDLLAALGGYDIAGMTGAFLGGAVHRVPVVVDGVISAVAALAAARICPAARDFMLASHVSREPASKLLLDALALEPVLCADMALGEGTGAVALFPLLDMAKRVYDSAHTFGALGMEPYAPR